MIGSRERVRDAEYAVKRSEAWLRYAWAFGLLAVANGVITGLSVAQLNSLWPVAVISSIATVVHAVQADDCMCRSKSFAEGYWP